MDVLERIKRGYRAIGPGASRDVLAMFHQEQADPPEWVVDDSIRVLPAREVVAMDLFAGALPSQWEVIGVDLRVWDYYTGKCRLVVAGRFRTRPLGTWEVVPLPFIHIWSVGDDDQVQERVRLPRRHRGETPGRRAAAARLALLAAGGGGVAAAAAGQNASWSPRRESCLRRSLQSGSTSATRCQNAGP